MTTIKRFNALRIYCEDISCTLAGDADVIGEQDLFILIAFYDDPGKPKRFVQELAPKLKNNAHNYDILRLQHGPCLRWRLDQLCKRKLLICTKGQKGKSHTYRLAQQTRRQLWNFVTTCTS